MDADVSAAHLRVLGIARIDGHAGRSHGNILVEGRVLDDAGSAVPSTAIAFSVAGATVMTTCGNQSAQPAPAQPALAQPALAQPAPAQPAPARTDESGRFCVWIAANVGAYKVHVEVAATEWLARTWADYDVDLAKRSVELRFDPEPRIVTLDAEPAPLDALATYDDDATGAGALPLELSTETGSVIATATTITGGRATFVVDPRKLGAPGRGALRVRYAGSDDTMASEHVTPIQRDVHVALALEHDVAPASPEDGVPLDIKTVLGRGPTPSGDALASGSIEARVDGVVVGATVLQNGRGTVNAVFVSKTKTSQIQLRYVPDVPWFQETGDLRVDVPLRGPSPWRQVPLAVGALAVAAWLLVGRSARRMRLDRTIVMQRPPTHEGTAGISVVHSSRSRVGKFGGRVVDAHDGSPVPRARLAVQAPSFSRAVDRGDSVIVSVFADDEGRFEFDLESAPPDVDLVVEAPLHAELRQKLPVAGVLEVALVSRRRKLLERLVQWAKRRGPPFDARPEPTPAHVRRAAESAMPGQDGGAAAWASAVERAAFDQGDVDARAEADVMDLDPEKPKFRV